MSRKLVVVAVFISLLFAGCAPAAFVGGAALGIGGYKYYNGALIVIYKAPFDETWNNSVSALENLDYQIFERNRKLTSGTIKTTGSIKERITLSLKYVSLEETEVKIKVGLLGDEVDSTKIKDKIGELLFGDNLEERNIEKS